MKLKNTFLALLTLATASLSTAQSAADCDVLLSIYAENAKAKNYTEAFKQLPDLMEHCANKSAAIYQYGEYIYENRIKTKTGNQEENVAGLLKMLHMQVDQFPNVVNVSKKKIEIARTMYKYKIGTQTEQFDILKNVYASDKKNFTDPNGIITFFTLAEKEFKADRITLQELFDLYDDLSDSLGDVQDERSIIVSDLTDKKEEGTITPAEEKQLNAQTKNLKNYNIVEKSINGTLGQLANCDRLIPLYNADFNTKSSDEKWLTGVLKRLYKKDCTDDPLYIKSVKALHVIKPSGKTAFGLGNIATSQTEKFQYWDEALSLGVDNDIVYTIHNKKAKIFKSKGQYSSAKAEYLAAIKAKPSNGRPYLSIANMIASSANSCGDTPFKIRAVNWVAARYSRKAASIDAGLKATANKATQAYIGRAPSSDTIFMTDGVKSGDTIRFNCWIGESVRIP